MARPAEHDESKARSVSGDEDSLFASLRIQAAAVVAQQSALTELEIRLTDREAALARQESQLATHLEKQRRELLDLQDQISHARASLREKRAAFTVITAEHESHLKKTRREIEKAKKHVAARETRIARLWTKFKSRIRHQKIEIADEQNRNLAEIARERKHLDVEQTAFEIERQRFHGQAELEKRQITDGWKSVHDAEAKLNERLAAMATRERTLANKEKELIVVVREQTQAERNDRARRDSLRREIESLQARAVNARDALDRVRHREPSQGLEFTSPSPAAEKREIRLAELADTLADEQSLLTEHVDRFAGLRLEWEEERIRALAEFDNAAAELASRERDLAIRAAEIAEGEARITAEEHAIQLQAQRIEADRVRAATEASDRRAELDRRADQLNSMAREQSRREESLADLYRLWGQRRSTAIAALTSAQEANANAREEWATLYSHWLRARTRLVNDQQDLSARQLAVEQYRRECVDAADHPELAARRLERLRRQWLIRCAGNKRELVNLASALKKESERLDRRFVELQRDEMHLNNRAADIDQLFASAETQQLLVANERTQFEEVCGAHLAARESYERQLAELRDQMDHLASLFIETPESAGVRAA